jgi:hypothetical protein
MGIDVRAGNPRENKPGERIVIPEKPEQLAVVEVDLDHLRRSYLRNAAASLADGATLSDIDYDFLAEDTRWPLDKVKENLDGMR